MEKWLELATKDVSINHIIFILIILLIVRGDKIGGWIKTIFSSIKIPVRKKKLNITSESHHTTISGIKLPDSCYKLSCTFNHTKVGGYGFIVYFNENYHLSNEEKDVEYNKFVYLVETIKGLGYSTIRLVFDLTDLRSINTGGQEVLKKLVQYVIVNNGVFFSLVILKNSFDYTDINSIVGVLQKDNANYHAVQIKIVEE